CGTCLSFCPVYKNTNDEAAAPRGKLSLIEAISQGKLDFTEKVSDKIYICTMCGYCDSECPGGVKVAELFEEMRQDLVDSEKYPRALNFLKRRINEAYNVTFDTNEGRIDWTKQILDSKPEDFLKNTAEVIYFVGCVSSFSPRTFSIPRSIVKVFRKADVDFGLLGDEEWCCGFPLLSSGMKSEAMKLADHNIKMVREKEAKVLITSCPSCYHTWKHEYPKISSEKIDFEIMHISQYILKLINDGKIKLNKLDRRVSYHDPCDLGRNSDVYDEPRKVIGAIPGVEFIELEANRNFANCCGGGGNLESLDAGLSGKIAGSRAREIIEADIDILVSACQQCERTLAAALKKLKKEVKRKIKVRDIAELVLESMDAE
ncbi:MAG: (Fe-S)-binding protein, partial [Actinomycetia bacterium]|nr:(Fe-S)-binding protein [Actinomycetes bacterium]